MPTVAVLMSTYNGEKYIREQIDSILDQRAVDMKLIIRDDGSVDNTKVICQEYAKNNTNIEFHQGSNVGVGKSFMKLLIDSPEAEYYAFSDQDDVWLEDKLERAISKINEMDDVPVLYTSNQILVNENLEKQGMRYKSEPRHDLLQEIASNKLSGCTMVMNQVMRDIIIANDNLPSNYILNTRIHDTWIMIMASVFGTIIYDEDSRIMYRQHENNVVGAKKKTLNQIIRDKLNRFWGKKYKGNRSKIASYVLKKFSAQLTISQMDSLKLIIESRSLKGAMRLLRNQGIRSAFRESDLLLFSKCLLGWI